MGREKAVIDFKISPSGNLVKYLGNNKNVVIPQGISGIYRDAFKDCKFLESIVIPEGVEQIASNAFNNCTALSKAILPKSLKAIATCAFKGCVSLQRIDIPDTVTKIGQYAFEGCEALKFIKLPKGLNEIGGVFSNCKSLESVEIPDSVTSIELGAFSGCESLRSLYIPPSVTQISCYAFSDCVSLKEIVFSNANIEIDSDAFYRCFQLYNAYEGCYYLGRGENPYFFLMSPIRGKKIDFCKIHKDTKNICRGAFSSCKDLIKVVIPDSVLKIGEKAFAYCECLQEIVISNSVAHIEDRTFDQCIALQKVIVPNSIKEIGKDAFSGCIALEKIVIPDTVLYIHEQAFEQCHENMILYVSPKSYSEEYARNKLLKFEYWSDELDQIEGEDLNKGPYLDFEHYFYAITKNREWTAFKRGAIEPMEIVDEYVWYSAPNIYYEENVFYSSSAKYRDIFLLKNYKKYNFNIEKLKIVYKALEDGSPDILLYDEQNELRVESNFGKRDATPSGKIQILNFRKKVEGEDVFLIVDIYAPEMNLHGEAAAFALEEKHGTPSLIYDPVTQEYTEAEFSDVGYDVDYDERNESEDKDY